MQLYSRFYNKEKKKTDTILLFLPFKFIEKSSSEELIEYPIIESTIILSQHIRKKRIKLLPIPGRKLLNSSCLTIKLSDDFKEHIAVIGSPVIRSYSSPISLFTKYYSTFFTFVYKRIISFELNDPVGREPFLITLSLLFLLIHENRCPRTWCKITFPKRRDDFSKLKRFPEFFMEGEKGDGPHEETF